MLSCDGVEQANSGHPGMPMGMAELAAVLWLKHLKHNPSEPSWLARDRFVLSNGHGSMLQYSMLHLSGYDVSIDDLKNFRQWGSKTPGHPENFITPGVETTTGPLGQGVANAVGMALGQKMMAAKYSDDDFNPVEHAVWCFAGDGCLMEGISGEASSLAGHLGLDNLIMVYDDNEISIAGSTDLAFTEDVAKRYEAYGWAIIHCDGHDTDDIDRAYAKARAQVGKPTIVIAKTSIGKGRNIRFGVREHAMGAIMNGLSYYGGYIPFGSTFFCFLDYMRPAVRLAALSHIPGLFIFTHDSIFLGEDGPTHQPVEHLPILRATPNLWTFRPADALETAVCYAMALERTDCPSAMVLTRQGTALLKRAENFDRAEIRRGAYVVEDCSGEPDVVLVATGSEVGLAIETAALLSEYSCRVVSMPCVEAFMAESAESRAKIIPATAKKIVIEAANPFGWATVLDSNASDLLVVGIDGFGASAPIKALKEQYGFSDEQIAQRVREFVA
ncbi:UNVERIFIED_CONTAM: hypothetical protein GTU68_012859 [Idotea baltica]|nr:hypothetical protein [Idotea baltica]